jgi:hypothetical protein
MIQMTKLETGQICKMILICNDLWKKLQNNKVYLPSWKNIIS